MSLKAAEASVAFQVGTSRFQTWNCSPELRPGHINQLSAGLQGSGKGAVARNAPDCTAPSYGRKALKNTPTCGQCWAGPHAHPQGKHTQLYREDAGGWAQPQRDTGNTGTDYPGL